MITQKNYRLLMIFITAILLITFGVLSSNRSYRSEQEELSGKILISRWYIL